MKRIVNLLYISILVTFLLVCCTFTVSAEKLPNGSVVGLPEHIVVLDDSGNSVSSTGEYFFIVEGMTAGEVYSKQIQIMNLREDKTYRISMKAEPVFKAGEIDLENECVCEILLDGKTVYNGKVTGEGSPDIREKALDLGVYAPSFSKTMTVNVVWNGTSAGSDIDNGKRIVTASGTEVVRAPDGNSVINGETEFKWIFYAEVTDKDEKDTPTNPNGSSERSDSPMGGFSSVTSFVKTGGIIAVGSLVIILMATSVLVVMLAKKRKRRD